MAGLRRVIFNQKRLLETFIYRKDVAYNSSMFDFCAICLNTKVAVGMPVTRHPRTDPDVRNYLIRLIPRVITRKRCHTGLASPTDCLPYLISSRFKSEAECRLYPWLYPRFPASCPFRVHHVRSFTGAASGTCFTEQIPLGQPPSLHLLRALQRTAALVRRLHRYY